MRSKARNDDERMAHMRVEDSSDKQTQHQGRKRGYK